MRRTPKTTDIGSKGYWWALVLAKVIYFIWMVENDYLDQIQNEIALSESKDKKNKRIRKKLNEEYRERENKWKEKVWWFVNDNKIYSEWMPI